MATVFSGYFLLKVVLTALIVVGVAELSKHYSFLAAFLVSLPLTSILAFAWMHLDGQSNEAIAALSQDIFWLVIPSLVFFIVLSYLLRLNFSFLSAMLIAALATALSYGVMSWAQSRMA